MGKHDINVDVRIICSSNKDLKKKLKLEILEKIYFID